MSNSFFAHAGDSPALRRGRKIRSGNLSCQLNGGMCVCVGGGGGAPFEINSGIKRNGDGERERGRGRDVMHLPPPSPPPPPPTHPPARDHAKPINILKLLRAVTEPAEFVVRCALLHPPYSQNSATRHPHNISRLWRFRRNRTQNLIEKHKRSMAYVHICI